MEIENIQVLPENYETTIDKQIASDEDNYQILAYSVAAFSRYAFEKNALVNLYDVENLNLEKPWWSSTFNDEAVIDDTLCFATGSLSLSLTRFLFAVFYNKSLAENYSSNNDDLAELTELYSIVESGKWTFDKFYELGNTIYNDLNGNSEADIEDAYGIGFQKGISIDSIWSSFDINILSKTSDGWFELDVNTDKLFDSMEKIYDLVYNTTGCYVAASELESLRDKFSGVTLLFMVNKLHAIESDTMRNMQSEYGLLPFPKYDEKQEDYYSFSHDNFLVFAIPATNRDIACTGAVLEAMASYSYRATSPAYLDIALKGKYMNDPQSRKMIDLVVDGFKVDAAWIYLETLGNWYPNNFRGLIVEGFESYSSTHAKSENGIKKVLKTYKKILGI